MIDARARAALEDELGDAVRFDVPMSRHTALRVGGPADAVATPTDAGQLVRLLRLCTAHDLSRTVLGAGFNVLVRDGGIDGVVILLRKLRRIEMQAGPVICAQAGASHTSVARSCIENGLAGLEFAAGIPGTVGGWVAMNAGIGSREMEGVVREIEVVAGDGGTRRRWTRDELDFRYRGLHGLPAGSLVVSASLKVRHSTSEAVRAEVDRLLSSRAESQPLDTPSCGSVFRNPAGQFAGRLIERAGLKGERVGGAQISPRHANFIANTGGATASDVLELVERARRGVRKASGIELETEVVIMGRAL